MPGTSSEIVTDPLKTYPDQALIAKIAADLSTQFQYGWLEHYFEVFLSETLEKLDEIWPGPGGEAPKAYAW